MPNPTSSVPVDAAAEPSEWKQKFIADDGTVSHGPETQAAWDQYVIQAEAEHRAAVQSLTPTARRAYARYKRTGVLPQPQVRTTPRPRGAGRPAVRRATQRSSARSGDSGGDGDPPQSTVDGLLRGLRLLAKEYELKRVYELIPGGDGEPDRWKARCPVHPSASAYTVLITELPGGRADVWCSVGCDPGGIVRILVPDPERDARAAAYAEVLLWAQSYGKRRAA